MRFLADESCDFIMVNALREAGHDVLAVSEITVCARSQVAILFIEAVRNISRCKRN